MNENETLNGRYAQFARLDNVDIVKGIAIITVTICHILDVLLEERSSFQKWGYSWELFAFFCIAG